VYVPPSTPPPPRRFQLETTERISKLRPPPADVASAYSSRPPPSSPSPSLPALVWSEPPLPASRKWRERVSSTVAAVAGASLGLGVVVCGFLLSKTLVDAARTSGTLVVNASGAHHERLLGIEVYVDAKLRCTDVPCKVSDLDRGSHLVRVAANAHQPSADRAVMIDDAEDRVFQVELTRQPTSGSPPAGRRPLMTPRP
jgi:hypothetical protein